MIEKLKGIVDELTPTKAVIMCGGVGYAVSIPTTVANSINLGAEETIFIRSIYRENAQSLYGFSSSQSRDIFDKVTSISGIGPKIGIAILSVFSSAQLSEIISQNNIAAMQKVPGIGKKTAERVVLELKSKLDLTSFKISDGVSSISSSASSEAVEALVSLGVNRQKALAAVEKAKKQVEDPTNVEEIIKKALSVAMS
ncbi:MAG: Holliday junction branch migration protein RuvA [Candidatus Kapaibacteriales bacterium]